MGRPPLNVVSTNVRLDPELLARIDRLVGKGKRAQIIRLAVENYVAALELGGRLAAREE